MNNEFAKSVQFLIAINLIVVGKTKFIVPNSYHYYPCFDDRWEQSYIYSDDWSKLIIKIPIWLWGEDSSKVTNNNNHKLIQYTFTSKKSTF